MFSIIIKIYFYSMIMLTNTNFLYLILKFLFIDHHLLPPTRIIMKNFFQFDPQARLYILIIFKYHHITINNLGM